LKKLAKPFSLTKKTSTANPLLQGMTKPEDVDDLLSELSTPGLQDFDFVAQRRYIENLSQQSVS